MLAALAGCSTFDQQAPAPIVEGQVQPQPAPMPEATPPEPVAEPEPPQVELHEVRAESERTVPRRPHRSPRAASASHEPSPAPPAPAPLIASRLLYPRQIKGLLDTPVQRPDGKAIGRAVDLVVDASGVPREIMVNLTGFMGVGDRKVGFPAGALRARPVGSRATGALELVPSRASLIDPARLAHSGGTPSGTVPLMDATVLRANGSRVGRIVDVLIDAGLRPQAAVLELGNLISPDRRRIAADWSALHFVMRDQAIQLLLELSDVQLNAAPSYDVNRSIRAVSPAPASGAAAAPNGGSAARGAALQAGTPAGRVSR